MEDTDKKESEVIEIEIPFYDEKTHSGLLEED